MKQRPLSRVVGSCFYAELRAFGKLMSRSGEEAFDAWLASYPPREGEEFESVKARTDLTALGRQRFASEWDALVEWYEEVGRDTVYEQLDRQLGTAVTEGYARRSARARRGLS